MFDWKDMIPFAVIFGVIMIVGLGLIGLCLIFDSRHITIEVDKKIVFQGRAYCASVRSLGANTLVNIGLPCEIPNRYYASKEVRVY